MDQINNREAHQDYNRREGGKFTPRRRVCLFCSTPSLKIDYKDTALLSRFITDQAKVEPRRRSGTCAKHQRALVQAIKRARQLALIPIALKHVYQMGNMPIAPPVPVVQTPLQPNESTVSGAEQASRAMSS